MFIFALFIGGLYVAFTGVIGLLQMAFFPEEPTDAPVAWTMFGLMFVIWLLW